MAPRPGWRGYDGTLYEEHDPRLLGWGSPPCDPKWSAKYIGAGQRTLAAVMIDGDAQDPGKIVEV